MIKEIAVYTIICDCCGKNSSDESGYCGWNNIEHAWDCAVEDNWAKNEDKHYCPDCYHYDDNNNLVIKESINDFCKCEIRIVGRIVTENYKYQICNNCGKLVK